jgi:hypothetical protein
MGTVVKRNLFENVEYTPNHPLDFGEKVDKFVDLSSRNIKSARLWIDIDATDISFFGIENVTFGADPKATIKFNGNTIFQSTYNKKTWGSGRNPNSTDGRWDVTRFINKRGGDKVEVDLDYAGQHIKFILFIDIVYVMNVDDNVNVTITEEGDENTAGSELGKGVDEFGKEVGKGIGEFFSSPAGIAVVLGLGGILIFSLSGGARRMAYSGAKAGYKRLRK